MPASSCWASGWPGRRRGPRTRERRIGLALLAGVLAKLLLEAPWDIALRPDALLGIAVAPLAHACGVAAGAAAWAAVSAVTQATRRQ